MLVHSVTRLVQRCDVSTTRMNKPSICTPVQRNSNSGSSHAENKNASSPATPMSSARRPTLLRQNHSRTTTASHSTAPVREAVTPLPMASRNSAQGTVAAKIDNGSEVPALSPCRAGPSCRASINSSASALISSKVAC